MSRMPLWPVSAGHTVPTPEYPVSMVEDPELRRLDALPGSCEVCRQGALCTVTYSETARPGAIVMRVSVTRTKAWMNPCEPRSVNDALHQRLDLRGHTSWY
jgi:hypothetical protein